MATGRRWTIRDRYGNEIYLTDERWKHITDAVNHPEMADCEELVKQAIQVGSRRQDSLNPRKYRYSKAFDGLAEGNTHLVAIVLFRLSQDPLGQPVPNNHIVTAYQKEIG